MGSAATFSASVVVPASPTAEPTDPDATVAYADGTALADADPAAGHQVYLGDGLNTVRVTVSAQRKTPRV